MFQTKEEFLNCFEGINRSEFVESSDCFYGPVILKDSFGFSVKRNYPEKLAIPPKRIEEANKVSRIAVIWVVLKKDKKDDNGLVPLFLKIAYYVPFEDDNNNEVNAKLPFYLEARDEYFYDENKKEFIDRSGKKIKPVSIIGALYQQHCDTVHPLKGLELRLKLFLRRKFLIIIGYSIDFLRYLMKIFFNTFVPECTSEINNKLSDEYFNNNNKSNNVLQKEEDNHRGSFLGLYKTTSAMLLLVCIVSMFLIYKISNSYKGNQYVGYVYKSDVLIMVHLLFLVILIEMVLPLLIRLVLKILCGIKSYLSLKDLDPFWFQKHIWILLPLIAGVFLGVYIEK